MRILPTVSRFVPLRTGEIFTWLGILGGAITTFSNLQAVLSLADWARALVQTWAGWVNLMWAYVLFPLQVNIWPGSRFQATMAIALMCAAVGAYLSSAPGSEDNHWRPRLSNVLRLNVFAAVLFFTIQAWFIGYYINETIWADMPDWFRESFSYINLLVYACVIYLGLAHWPISAAFTAIFAAIVFSLVFQEGARAFPVSPDADRCLSLLVGNGLAIFSGLLVLYLAPPRAFAKRLRWIIMGLVFLIALNAISLLNDSIFAKL
ncbi:MAG: hypothetical protein AAGC70_04060 [Pseudomonadota bacterium]